MLPALGQELMQQFLYPPESLPTKLDGHSAHRAAFGGLFWVFIASNHANRFPHKEMFLSKEGSLPEKGAFLFSELGSQRQGSCGT
jgi:hypothetical protein